MFSLELVNIDYEGVYVNVICVSKNIDALEKRAILEKGKFFIIDEDNDEDSIQRNFELFNIGEIISLLVN